MLKNLGVNLTKKTKTEKEIKVTFQKMEDLGNKVKFIFSDGENQYSKTLKKTKAKQIKNVLFALKKPGLQKSFREEEAGIKEELEKIEADTQRKIIELQEIAQKEIKSIENKMLEEISQLRKEAQEKSKEKTEQLHLKNPEIVFEKSIESYQEEDFEGAEIIVTQKREKLKNSKLLEYIISNFKMAG